MLFMNIHDITSIRISRARKQPMSTTSYVRHLIICSKEGELDILLFAKDKESIRFVGSSSATVRRPENKGE